MLDLYLNVIIGGIGVGCSTIIPVVSNCSNSIDNEFLFCESDLRDILFLDLKEQYKELFAHKKRVFNERIQSFKKSPCALFEIKGQFIKFYHKFILFINSNLDKTKLTLKSVLNNNADLTYKIDFELIVPDILCLLNIIPKQYQSIIRYKNENFYALNSGGYCTMGKNLMQLLT